MLVTRAWYRLETIAVHSRKHAHELIHVVFIGDEHRAAAELVGEALASATVEPLHSDHDRETTVARPKSTNSLRQGGDVLRLPCVDFRGVRVEVERAVVALTLLTKPVQCTADKVWLHWPPERVDRADRYRPAAGRPTRTE